MSTDVAGVSKCYGDVDALHGVSLSIGDGEFVAVLGPSGCGKSTLLRVLAGFETPTTGEVRIGSRVVARPGFLVPTERRDLGMVFQSFALWPHLDVASHIRFPLRHQRSLSAPAMGERVREVLDLTGLSELAHRLPHQLSGGQRQRVALARAIAARPSMLLMDEPLSSLDAALREEMRAEITQLHRRTQASIVYVTHDQSEALAMADRVVVMLDGQVEQIGTPWEVFHRPGTEFVARFVGKANLVTGVWDGDFFRPAAAPGLAWDGVQVAEKLRATDVFPARPDQLELLPGTQSAGVSGRVITALFQGSHTEYAVAVGEQRWQVPSASTGFGIGSLVTVALRPNQYGVGDDPRSR